MKFTKILCHENLELYGMTVSEVRDTTSGRTLADLIASRI